MLRNRPDITKCVRRAVLVAAAALIVVDAAGCAGVSHRAIAYHPLVANSKGSDVCAENDAAATFNASADRAVDGIRYYETSLYVLVNSDGKGGVVWRILELPDQTRMMAVHPYNLIAQLDTAFAFNNGTLTGTKERADTTAIPRAVVDAVAKFAGTALKVAALGKSTTSEPSKGPPYQVPAVELYKIVVKPDSIELNGGPGDTPIVVTLNPDITPASQHPATRDE